MASVLINYASNHGHTSIIARNLSAMMSRRGVSVDLHEVEKNDALDPASFDAVVVMASIHAGRHQSKMRRWVEANSEVLNQRSSAFLSVSLSNGSDSPEAVEVNREQAEAFCEATDWKPDRIELVAGCLQYPAYNFLNRFLMKRVAKKQGLPLDTSREHEYTDWEALDQFTGEFPPADAAGSPKHDESRERTDADR